MVSPGKNSHLLFRTNMKLKINESPLLKAHEDTPDGQDFQGRRIRVNDCYSNHQNSVKCSKGAFIEGIQSAITEKSECAIRDQPISKLLLVESNLRKNDAGTQLKLLLNQSYPNYVKLSYETFMKEKNCSYV